MRRTLIAIACLALLAGVGCDAGVDGGAGSGGHLRVVRKAARTSTLMDEPGRAEYCASDSLLTIVALGRGHGAGFAIRTTLPLRQTTGFGVQSTLAGPGSATAAFRLADGSGRVAASGQLRLRAATDVGGDFDVSISDTAGTPVRYVGTLENIPVRALPPASCPHP